uniref:Uncharacterized AAA domain-containing protein ycf46 n=1 Tax=Dasya naccarioides TaxID=2007180 RepID=A0A1Z1MGU5_9FLOR|nr:hypothetical protein [Dasya naccarioides]ARW65082.1 hypothetical protein [Dasya naccarioides]
MTFETNMQSLLSSKNFLIYIVTEEEERLEYALNYISKKIFQQNICNWDFINGYNHNPNYNTNTKKNPLEALENIKNINTKICLFKDFSFFINDISIIRKLKNINSSQNNEKYIIMSSAEIEIPTTLREYIALIYFPLPSKIEIKLELKRLFKILNIYNHISFKDLTIAYQGFSINRIRKSISQTIINEKLNENIINKILEEKKEIIQQTKILDFYNSDKNLKDIAGLKNLKKWLKVRNNAFSEKAHNYGITTPKGILLVGIQGTGKSLSAKAIAVEWRLPLLKLDISKIFAGILGESESNIKKVIDICEQIEPCILWVDEIDKIFNKNSQNDSGTTNRINNIFLTWLSEKTSNVFIVATANNISHLPIEILRKGRFDEIFFVDLPNFEERINIFKIHLEKVRKLTWYKYNIYYLSQISNYFSGAEIEQAINEAMYTAFYEDREFNTYDIRNSITNTVPLSFTNRENINELQQWLKSGKFRSA